MIITVVLLSLSLLGLWVYLENVESPWATKVSYIIWGLGILLMTLVVVNGLGIAWLILMGWVGAIGVFVAGVALKNKRIRWASASWLWPLSAVLIVRTFVYEPYRIPSSSMVPGLEIGDYIFVSRFAYGLRPAEFGLTGIGYGEPQRGEVIVFYNAESRGELVRLTLIKRVIGLPGDEIRVKDSRVWVNGQPLPCEAIILPLRRPAVESDLDITHCREITENGISYIIADDTTVSSREGVWTVPHGEYMVLGDNRDNSRDSRFWGTVKSEEILGRAEYVWMRWQGFPQLPDFSYARPIN